MDEDDLLAGSISDSLAEELNSFKVEWKNSRLPEASTYVVNTHSL